MTNCRNKHCDNEFVQYSTLQRLCIPCSIEKGRKIEKKIERKEHREAKEKVKRRGAHLKDAQTACNAYIRERDKDEGCISCGTRNPDIQYCAGHYKSRGAHTGLRFHPLNLNKQCNAHCNMHLSGAIDKYRPALIEKIGVECVEWLEGEQQIQNWSIEDIVEIKFYYREQLKLLKSFQ